VTHRGTRFHLHALNGDPERRDVAHIDSPTIEPGAVLWLPAIGAAEGVSAL
jgi:hypothetical protein